MTDHVPEPGGYEDLMRRLQRYLHSDEYETRMANNEIDPELQEVLEALDALLEGNV